MKKHPSQIHRIPRLKVKLSRKNIFQSAEVILQIEDLKKDIKFSILEIEYNDEVGTGLA